MTLDAMFQRAKADGRLAFLPFLPAGTPTVAEGLALLPQLVDAGADAVELGFPFSDPVADGPVIAASYDRALRAGFKVDALFEQLPTLRLPVPVIGMASVSLIERRGRAAFLAGLTSAGFGGLIVPDLPLEEAEPLAALAGDLPLSLLVTPLTPPDRARRIMQLCTGFVYCVSAVGITGERSALPTGFAEQLRRWRDLTDRPLVVGFGIGQAAQVTALRGLADGVIAGSALVRRLESGGVAAMLTLARQLADAAHADIDLNGATA